MRSKAATNSVSSSARMTPRLPERPRGFRTQGYSIAAAASRGFESSGTAKFFGTPSPARANASRMRRLLRQRATAAGGCQGSPSRRRKRGDGCGAVGYGDDTVGPMRKRGRVDKRGKNACRLFGLFEADGNGAVAPGIFEDVAAICGERDFDAEAAGCLCEGASLITGSGGDQEDAGQVLLCVRRGVLRFPLLFHLLFAYDMANDGPYSQAKGSAGFHRPMAGGARVQPQLRRDRARTRSCFDRDGA